MCDKHLESRLILVHFNSTYLYCLMNFVYILLRCSEFLSAKTLTCKSSHLFLSVSLFLLVMNKIIFNVFDVLKIEHRSWSSSGRIAFPHLILEEKRKEQNMETFVEDKA